jgi:hypothetical protein
MQSTRGPLVPAGRKTAEDDDDDDDEDDWELGVEVEYPLQLE